MYKAVREGQLFEVYIMKPHDDKVYFGVVIVYIEINEDKYQLNSFSNRIQGHQYMKQRDGQVVGVYIMDPMTMRKV
jgi:hypothetical protein